MSNFTTAHQFTAKWEGGKFDHPNDPGGLTMYGFSIAFARDLASNARGRALLQMAGIPTTITRQAILAVTPQQVAIVFKGWFWDHNQLDQFPLPLAVATYDAAVNSGSRQGVILSQRALNSLADPALREDGIVGPLTIAAASKATLDTAILAVAKRENFFRGLASQKAQFKSFIKGWLNRAADLKAYLKKLGKA